MAEEHSTNPFALDMVTESSSATVQAPSQSEIPSNPPNAPPKLSLDAIARKLLEENFVLTALEFHTELVEARKELPRLRDYFSNPANFELVTPTRPDVLTGFNRMSKIFIDDCSPLVHYR